MSAPEDEGLQRAASKALLPNIDKIRTFFELSRDMEQVWPMTSTLLARSIVYFLWYSVLYTYFIHQVLIVSYVRRTSVSP